MREIKFRVWDKSKKRMRQGLPVDFIIDPYGGKIWETTRVFEKWQEVNGVLMQFTGFKDIHGTEVYEGDVLAWPDDDADNRNNDALSVVWFAGGFVLNLDGSPIWDYAIWTKHKGGRLKDPTDELEELEVVGNIYENPELIR